MTESLNLVNMIADSSAEYLRDIETDDDTSSVDIRHMDLYVTHNNLLVAIGYVNSNLVWFSVTSLSDLLLSRRIYDCMKQGVFYRRVALSTLLEATGMTEKSLQTMCHVRVDGIQNDKPIFSDCIVSDSSEFSEFNGSVFADIIAIMPKRLRAAISDIGSNDDIITELEKDYQQIELLYNEGVGLDDIRRNNIHSICEKWSLAPCLKLSERATIRTTYHKICYFETNVMSSA